MTVRTSSTGPIGLTRSGVVSHSRPISSRNRRLTSAWSAGMPTSSSASTRAATRRSAAATARRRASVGWAVSTGCTRSPASSSANRPGSALNSSTAAASDSRRGPPPGLPVPLFLREVRLAAQHPYPVPFLGQVGQVEVDGEGLGHQFGAGQRPARHQRRDLVAGQVGLVPRRLVPGRDDRAAQPFHVVEQALATGLADHLAEQVAEKPDIPAQRDGQFLAVRFPAHCPQPSAVQFPGTVRQVRR